MIAKVSRNIITNMSKFDKFISVLFFSLLGIAIMIKQKTDSELLELATKNFENIRQSLTGLLELLNITFSENENKIYFDLALDNIDGLYQNFLELILNERGLNLLLHKLRHTDMEVGINLNEILKDRLKELKQKSPSN